MKKSVLLFFFEINNKWKDVLVLATTFRKRFSFSISNPTTFPSITLNLYNYTCRMYAWSFLFVTPDILIIALWYIDVFFPLRAKQLKLAQFILNACLVGHHILMRNTKCYTKSDIRLFKRKTITPLPGLIPTKYCMFTFLVQGLLLLFNSCWQTWGCSNV